MASCGISRSISFKHFLKAISRISSVSTTPWSYPSSIWRSIITSWYFLMVPYLNWEKRQTTRALFFSIILRLPNLGRSDAKAQFPRPRLPEYPLRAVWPRLSEYGQISNRFLMAYLKIRKAQYRNQFYDTKKLWKLTKIHEDE